MRLGIAICLLACTFAGCDRRRDSAPSLDDFARQYIRLAVALGEHDPDALDYYAGPPSWVADIRNNPPKLDQVRQSATDLADRVASAPVKTADDRDRKQFLLGQIKAIAARADLLLRFQKSKPLPTFEQEALELFGVAVDAAPPDAVRFAIIRGKLAKLLPGSGTLADRYASFEQRFVIPEDRVPSVMARSMQLCREQTLHHMQLPPGENLRIDYVRDRPWAGYSYYQGHYQSLVDINVDLGITVDQALQLACHEGYPGHHVFNSLAEQNLAVAKHRIEWLVQPTFSPQSFLSEGSAVVAGQIAFADAERERVEADVLFPLAGLKPSDVHRYLHIEGLIDQIHPLELDLARDYIDGRLDFARAAAAFEDQALMAHPEGTLRYLNEYRSYAVTYTEGRDCISAWLSARAGVSQQFPDPWAAFADLLATPSKFFLTNSTRK